MSFSTLQSAKKKRKITDLDTKMTVSKQYEYFSVLSTCMFFFFVFYCCIFSKYSTVVCSVSIKSDGRKNEKQDNV